MPLSEHEQRLLDEMERNLYGHDADVVSTTLSAMPRPNYRAIVIGVIVALAGLGALVTGVMMQMVIIGIAGFIAMFVGVLIASRPGQPREAAPAPAQKKSTSSFMQRMEQKWDERNDGRL
jgi:uncharacterized membrane protein YjjP (DUF1212 family)